MNMNQTIANMLIAFHLLNGPDPEDVLTKDGGVSDYTASQLQMMGDVLGISGQDLDTATLAIVLSAVGAALDSPGN